MIRVLFIIVLLWSSLSFAGWKDDIDSLMGLQGIRIYYFQAYKVWNVDVRFVFSGDNGLFKLNINTQCEVLPKCAEEVIKRYEEFRPKKGNGRK